MDKYPQFAYHTLTHIFSGILMNTDKFYNENILALAVDAAPDTIVDKEGFHKTLFAGAYVHQGEIEMIPVLSPAVLNQL